MSLNISRRYFLSASALSAMMLAPQLSAFNLSRTESSNICALIADDSLSKMLQKHLVRFREIKHQELIRQESISQAANLRSWLRNNKGHKILGAVGCDFYPVLESLVRELGGSSLLHGRHVVMKNSCSRHNFYTVPASQGAARHFMGSVGATNNQFQSSEFCIGASARIRTAHPPPVTTDWLETIANMMVAVANGGWQAGPVKQYPATHLFESASPTGSLETFVFNL